MGQPLGVAIIGGGSSPSNCKARGLGRRICQMRAFSYATKAKARERGCPVAVAAAPTVALADWRPKPDDIAHGPCRHTGRGRSGRRRRGGGRWKAQGRPQGRDDGDDGLSDGHIRELHEAAVERRPAQTISTVLLMANGIERHRCAFVEVATSIYAL